MCPIYRSHSNLACLWKVCFGSMDVHWIILAANHSTKSISSAWADIPSHWACLSSCSFLNISISQKIFLAPQLLSFFPKLFLRCRLGNIQLCSNKCSITCQFVLKLFDLYCYFLAFVFQTKRLPSTAQSRNFKLEQGHFWVVSLVIWSFFSLLRKLCAHGLTTQIFWKNTRISSINIAKPLEIIPEIASFRHVWNTQKAYDVEKKLSWNKWQHATLY